MEIAPRRINVVSPGMIDTPMHGPDGPERSKASDARCANNLIPRAGTADEVAEAVLWLLSERASYVTRSILDVAGGR